jgi:hypothetical protein
VRTAIDDELSLDRRERSADQVIERLMSRSARVLTL